ncbi:MAG: hypothetical protein M5U26_27645 [Planctomycetota bacterium]|nr:hypothetical protein [Planctomycetota bacterium]
MSSLAKKLALGLLLLAGLSWLAVTSFSPPKQNQPVGPLGGHQEQALEQEHAPSSNEPQPVRFAEAPPEGRFAEVEAGRYSARMGAIQVDVHPAGSVSLKNLPAGAREPDHLTWTLTEVRRGAETLYEETNSAHGMARVNEKSDGKGLSFPRGAHMQERCELLKDGVELLWDLAKAPAGKGDLVFTAKVDSNLLPLPEPSPMGVPFMNRRGDTGMRITNVLAKDLEGREIAVHTLLEADGATVRFALPHAWLEEAAYPIVIDPGLVVGTQTTITDNDGSPSDPTSPCVAGSDTQFCVMFNDLRFRNAPIMKAVLYPTAGPLAEIELTVPEAGEFPLGVVPQRSQVATDGTKFLAIWIDAAFNQILGSIVNADGSLEVFGTPPNDTELILIANTSGKVANELPLVAYHGGDNYIVVWHDRIGNGIQMQYCFVNRTNGQATQAKLVPGPSVKVKSQYGFFVTPGPNNISLLSMREINEKPLQTRVMRISSANGGEILDPQGISLFNDLRGEDGFGAPIGVAYNTTFGGWDLISTHDQTGDSYFYRHRLADDGTATISDGTPFAQMGFAPSGVPLEDSFPTAFYGSTVSVPGGGTGFEWLMVHNYRLSNGAYHFLAKRFDQNGAELDQKPVQIDDAAVTLRRNPVAAASRNFNGADDSRFLVCWLNGGTANPNLGTTLQGRLLDSGDTVNTNEDLVARLDFASATDPVAIKQNAPTPLDFDWSASDGLSFPELKQNLNFGDGSSLNVLAGTETASKTYVKAGVFFPRLRLSDVSLYQSNSVRKVTVGLGLGLPGADATVPGAAPIANGMNVNTALTISKLTYFLDFLNVGAPTDTLLVEGTLDPSLIPDTLIGKTVMVSVGGVELFPGATGFDDDAIDGTFDAAFTLDNNGGFESSNGLAQDRVRFNLNAKTGKFKFEIIDGFLKGGGNHHLVNDELNHQNPSVDRKIQFAIDVGAADFGTTTVVSLYTGKAGISGIGTYFYNGTGKEDTGSLTFKKVSVIETAKLNKLTMLVESTHTVTVLGKLIPPGGITKTTDPHSLPTDYLTPGRNFRFYVGEFDSGDLPLDVAAATKRLVYNAGNIIYKGVKGDPVMLFKLNRNTGDFTLKLLKVPAEVANEVGLPLAKLGKGAEELGVIADLFVGFDLDLRDEATMDDNFNFVIGGFKRITRKSAIIRSWK